MPQPKVNKVVFSRGARWSHVVKLSKPCSDFDWSTVSVACRLRSERSQTAPVIHTFEAEVTISESTGAAHILLDLPGWVSAQPGFTSKAFADLWVSRSNPQFGPYVIESFEFFIQPAT